MLLALSALPWLSLSVHAARLSSDLAISAALLGFVLANSLSSLAAPSRTRTALGALLLCLVIATTGTAMLLPEPGPGTFLGLFVLVGAALGVASRALVGREQLILWGALGGTLLSAGIEAANWGTAMGSGFAAAAFAPGGLLLLSRRNDDGPTGTNGKQDASGLAVAVAALSGALLASQLDWTLRALAPYSGDSIFAGPALLASALFGLSVGFVLQRRFGSRGPGPQLRLLTLAAAGALAVFALYEQLEWSLPGLVRRLDGLGSWPRAMALVGAENFLLVVPAALGLGATWESVVRDSPSRWSWIALGMAGAIWLQPDLLTALGSTGTACLWIAASLALAALCSLTTPTGGQRWLGALLAASLLLYAIHIANSPLDQRPFLQRYGALVDLAQFGPRTVLITDDSERGRLLRESSGQPRGGVGTDTQERVVAQLAMLAHAAPRRVLQLDFGVGNATSSILTHPVGRIDIADPDGVGAWAAPLFEESNLGALSDGRVFLHGVSPWTLLAESQEKWDLILLDVSALENRGREDILTIARLRRLKEHLTPGGVVSIAMNLGRISDEEARTLMRTALEEFAHLSLWEGPLGYVWIMNLSERAPALYFPDPKQADQNPDLATELDWLDLATPENLRARFVMDTVAAGTFAGPGPVVTSAHPRIDATSARSPLTFYGLGPAAADTALGDWTTGENLENTGLALLFARMERLRELPRSSPPPVLPLRRE